MSILTCMYEWQSQTPWLTPQFIEYMANHGTLKVWGTIHWMLRSGCGQCQLPGPDSKSWVTGSPRSAFLRDGLLGSGCCFRTAFGWHGSYVCLPRNCKIVKDFDVADVVYRYILWSLHVLVNMTHVFYLLIFARNLRSKWLKSSVMYSTQWPNDSKNGLKSHQCTGFMIFPNIYVQFGSFCWLYLISNPMTQLWPK